MSRQLFLQLGQVDNQHHSLVSIQLYSLHRDLHCSPLRSRLGEVGSRQPNQLHSQILSLQFNLLFNHCRYLQRYNLLHNRQWRRHCSRASSQQGYLPANQQSILHRFPQENQLVNHRTNLAISLAGSRLFSQSNQ
jgi:hypothetical protein